MYAYCDCRSGVSGDMFLAALCHLGLDLAPLHEKLAKIGIHCQLSTWQEQRAAGPGHRVEVTWEDNQPLRHPKDIADIFHTLDISENVLKKSLKVLEALTLAEAHAHQIKPEEVHFHEVGAIDTLVDIVGTVWGLECLQITELLCSPLPWFSGTIECEHGTLPLPAPATAYLLMQKPIIATNATTELVTPTGAALVHGLCTRFVDAPSGYVMRMGTGYGSRPAPAGLRICLVQDSTKDNDITNNCETIALLESHIDHLTGEEMGAALDALIAMPAVLDVVWQNATGKKNRPTHILRVLCHKENIQEVREMFFIHTHTLGIRQSLVERYILPRNIGLIECEGNNLAAKEYTLQDKKWVRPESDALVRKAKELGLGLPAMRIKHVKS